MLVLRVLALFRARSLPPFVSFCAPILRRGVRGRLTLFESNYSPPYKGGAGGGSAMRGQGEGLHSFGCERLIGLVVVEDADLGDASVRFVKYFDIIFSRFFGCTFYTL